MRYEETKRIRKYLTQGIELDQENIWKSTPRINVKKYEVNRWSEHAADSHPHTLLV